MGILPATASRPDTSALRIVVTGYVVRGPLAGYACFYLQYVMGLAALGHDVYFLEDSGDSPWCCYDPLRQTTDADPTYGIRFTSEAFDQCGLGDRWAYFDAHTSTWHGPCADRVMTICASADLLIDLDTQGTPRPWTDAIPHRALVDTDPGFTQAGHLLDPAALAHAAARTVHLTFAENTGRPGCTLPDDGLSWGTTRTPVVLDFWRVTPPADSGRFTTLMQWVSYPALQLGDRHFGNKDETFAPEYLGLPRLSDAEFELAVGGPAPRAELSANGWQLVNPAEVTRSLPVYQRWIEGSKAEFSVNKHGYVVCNSGWFSERSANYLASGRPVVVQDTGFSQWLPVGDGVLSFSSLGEAQQAIADVNGRYHHHCRAAREIAEAYFGADRILQRLIEDSLS